MQAFEEPLLLNLAAMFDYSSQAQRAQGDEQRESLRRMEEMLDICIAQSYMYISAAIKDDAKQFEKNNSKLALERFDAGRFIGRYDNLKKEIRAIGKRCRKNRHDYLAHFDDYKACYEKCVELERLIAEVNMTETLVQGTRNSWFWTAVGWVTSVGISVLVGKHIEKIWEAAMALLDRE